MSRLFKEVLIYFASVGLYILCDFLMYRDKNSFDFKRYFIVAIVLFIIGIIIEIIYTIVKKERLKKE